jgi:hypothetical protein
MGYGDEKGRQVFREQCEIVATAINSAQIATNYQIVTFDQTATTETTTDGEN